MVVVIKDRIRIHVRIHPLPDNSLEVFGSDLRDERGTLGSLDAMNRPENLRPATEAPQIIRCRTGVQGMEVVGIGGGASPWEVTTTGKRGINRLMTDIISLPPIPTVRTPP